MEQDPVVITVRKKEYRIVRNFDDSVSFQEMMLSYLLEERKVKEKKCGGCGHESQILSE